MAANPPPVIAFAPAECLIASRSARAPGTRPAALDLTPALRNAGYSIPDAVLLREGYDVVPLVFRRREEKL
jgi:hypothetical protein